MNTIFIFFAKYLVFLSVIVLGIFWLRASKGSKKRMALFAIPALLLTYAVGVLSGLVYYDPRPFVVEHVAPLIAHAADNGFPSDHTLLAAGIAMVACFWSRRLGLWLWAAAFAVAAGRVYVGVHHITDVIGSMAIAVIAVSLTYGIFTRVFRKQVV